MNALKIIGPCRGGIAAVREDGLRVFLDGDKVLDDIRSETRDPRLVILAVALRRAQQIAVGYAKKHAPHLVAEIEDIVTGELFGAPPGLPSSSKIASFSLIEGGPVRSVDNDNDLTESHDYISYPQGEK